MELIPLTKLSNYLNNLHISNYFCSKCDYFNERRTLFPYAYDEENNDVIFAATCDKCNNVDLFKE